MPDLSAPAVEAWLSQEGSVAIEPGAGKDDHPDVLPAVVAFGEALDGALERSLSETEAFLASTDTASHLQPVIAHLGPARRLRLLHFLSDGRFSDPRHLVERVTATHPDGTGQSIRRWLIDLQKRDLINAIFDPNRINLLLAACRETAQPEQ